MTVKNNIDCEDNEILQDTWDTKHSGDAVPTNDLVSLSWLQKDDILQITPLDEEEENGSDSLNSTVIKSQDSEDTNRNSGLPVESQESYYSSPPVSEPPLSIFGRSIRRPASVSGEQFYGETTRYRGNPSLTVTGKGLDKPNYSYTHLIFMAIESTPQKCMTVNQIYNWCESNFPFYKHAGAGWKNSLRHNLSINKSFKRLPRDSRGPGRGAFWTVEPRERATLLDAIKRTPWNSNNTSAAGGQSLNDSGSTNSVSAFPVGRFGLARSAPSQLLRAEGLGSDQFGSMVGESAPQIRLLYTSDGNVVATYDSSFIDPSNSGPDSTTDVKAMVSDSTFSDHRYWSSPSDEATSIDSASAEVEWPAEEEEKYLNILRLLNETEATNNAKLNSPTPDQPGGDGFLSNEVKRDAWEKMIGTHILEDPKLVTKQRRKSRLLPTRINKCNECKENVNGCESCLAKRSEVLNSNYVRTTLKEYDLDISNMLDCDQEPGPAGGPLTRNSNTKMLKPPPSPTAAKTDDDDLSDKKNPLKSEEEVYSSNEVYVTPSPYIDHEYSHCQAQLRRPEENQLVNKYNDNYFSERLTELMSLYPLVKAFVDTIVNDMNVDYETDGFDDGFSSSEQDMYSEDYDNENQQIISKDSSSHEQCDCDYISAKRSSSYRRQSCLQTSDFNVRQRRPKIASRGSIRRRRGGGGVGGAARAMKLSASLNSNPTRRSKRVIKAPRRPYDDFENVDYYDYELDNDESDRIVEKEEEEEDPRPSDVESENENQANHTENHKYRKNFFLSKSLKRPYQAIIDSHSNSDNCDRYLSPSIDADYESSDDNEDDNYHRYNDSAIQLSQIKNRKSSYEINNVWTSVMKCSVSRRKIHESIASEDCQHTFLEHDRTKEEDLDNSIVKYEEEVVEEPLEQEQRSEQTAVDAAHLLMGMSQIQSFKKQSGCVNLDSSEDSSMSESTMTLSLDTHPSEAPPPKPLHQVSEAIN
ncbi:unnamed protein product [Trichobilharzia szidati]|nr:unnamed protein product [Trichobilharzia szidati]